LGLLLLATALALILPLPVLFYQHRRFQDTAISVPGAIVRTHIAAFDWVEVSYKWHGIRHTSIVHVDDARTYSAVSFLDDYARLLVDRTNPGHATLRGELDFSPPTSVLYNLSLLALMWAVPVLVALGIALLVKQRRCRRILARFPWQEAHVRGRGTRGRTGRVGLMQLAIGSQQRQPWRPLFISGIRGKHRDELLDGERAEIAGNPGDKHVVVRVPGSSVLHIAKLGAEGASPLGPRVQRAAAESPEGPATDLFSTCVVVLDGSTAGFDLLDPDANLLAVLIRSSRSPLVYELRDRSGDLRLTIARQRHAGWATWTATDSQRREVVSIARPWHSSGWRFATDRPLRVRRTGRVTHVIRDDDNTELVCIRAISSGRWVIGQPQRSDRPQTELATTVGLMLAIIRTLAAQRSS
jgi:hypothetical protein